MTKSRLNAIIVSATLAASLSTPTTAFAQAEPFLGQITLYPYSFCPQGWTETNGQLLAISSNTALFSLLGTTYGGDGQTTFGLPDLRGRSAIGVGQGVGLSNINLGQKAGTENTALSQTQLPAHTHNATTTVTAQSTLHANSSRANTTGTPTNNVLAATTDNIYSTTAADVTMGTSSVNTTANATTTVAATGASQSFNIRDPYLGLRWCIALQGIYPSRN